MGMRAIWNGEHAFNGGENGVVVWILFSGHIWIYTNLSTRYRTKSLLFGPHMIVAAVEVYLSMQLAVRSM